jgi:hypothetical protein
MSTPKKGDVKPDGTVKVMPSEDPNRKEKLMVTIYQHSRTVIFTADILRDPNRLEEWKTFYDSSFPNKMGSIAGGMMTGKPYSVEAN